MPENRADHGSRTIRVGFARFWALGASSTSPVFDLLGGPGHSHLADVSRSFRGFDPCHAVADVVVDDQRGFSPRGETLTYEHAFAGDPLDRPCDWRPPTSGPRRTWATTSATRSPARSRWCSRRGPGTPRRRSKNLLAVIPYFPNSRVLIAEHGGRGVLGPINRADPGVMAKLLELVRTGDLPGVPRHIVLPIPKFRAPDIATPSPGASPDGE